MLLQTTTSEVLSGGNLTSAIQFGSATSGTRATLIAVGTPTYGGNSVSKLSKPHHLTPVSREVHLDGIQLKTLPQTVFGASGAGTDHTEPDDLTNRYASGKFDIATYILRRTGALPTATNISWTRTQADVCTVQLTVPGTYVSSTESGMEVFTSSGKNAARAQRDVLVASPFVSEKYLVIFGGNQAASGYFDLTAGSASGSNYTLTFRADASQWSLSRRRAVDNGTLTASLSDMQVLMLRCKNSGQDWTYPDATSSLILRQRSAYYGTGSAAYARANTATLFSKSADIMPSVYHGSAIVQQQSQLSYKELAEKVGSDTSTSTLINRQVDQVLHSDGTGNPTSTAGRGLGTIPMMTDERRLYRVGDIKNLSRFNTGVFKLVDLPTRMDMRDVVIRVVRPREIGQTTDPDADYFDNADILVMGQLSDFSHLIRDEAQGDATRIIHPYPTRDDTPPCSEMPMGKRDAAQAGEKMNPLTVDAMLRYHDRSIPVGLHPHQDDRQRTLNYRMACSAALGQTNLRLADASKSRVTMVRNTNTSYGQVTFETPTLAMDTRRQTGLREGDVVVVSTIPIAVPNDSKIGTTTQQILRGVVSAGPNGEAAVTEPDVTDATDSSAEVWVKFDAALPSFGYETTDVPHQKLYLTAVSRSRRVINESKAIAIVTPSWGFRNDAAHGPNSPVIAVHTIVRSGTYAVGINDTNRDDAVLDVSKNVSSVAASHYDASNRHRDHPFGVRNLVNMVPQNDVYDA